MRTAGVFLLGLALGFLSKWLDTIPHDGSLKSLLLAQTGQFLSRLGAWAFSTADCRFQRRSAAGQPKCVGLLRRDAAGVLLVHHRALWLFSTAVCHGVDYHSRGGIGVGLVDLVCAGLRVVSGIHFCNYNRLLYNTGIFARNVVCGSAGVSRTVSSFCLKRSTVPGTEAILIRCAGRGSVRAGFVRSFSLRVRRIVAAGSIYRPVPGRRSFPGGLQNLRIQIPACFSPLKYVIVEQVAQEGRQR